MSLQSYYLLFEKKHYAVMSTPSAIFSLYHIYSARKNIRTIISVWTASEYTSFYYVKSIFTVSIQMI